MTVMLVEQDVELGQLHQVIGRLQEEEKKASGRAEKLAEELKDEYFMAGVIAEVTSSFDRIPSKDQSPVRHARVGGTDPKAKARRRSGRSQADA